MTLREVNDKKPVDPKSKTRIAYAEVKFSAVNRDNKKQVSGTLHPMWGGSGLHYAANSPLAGDGTYETTITVGVPGFGRATADKNLWTTPVSRRQEITFTSYIETVALAHGRRRIQNC